MKGKTHQNLKAGVGWKSSDGRWSLVELSKKKERVGEQRKKGRDSRGGEEDSASTQGQTVNLGRAAAVHCFPGCHSGELESNLHVRAGFGYHLLEMEEAWTRQREGSNASSGSLGRRTPARELEPPQLLTDF
jgi:hypothetical protein